jgi:uncharacterized membrane-anchored protein YhcB (DUF1043 family)
MAVWIAFGTGLFIGVVFGFFAFAIFSISSRESRREEKLQRDLPRHPRGRGIPYTRGEYREK